MKRFSLLTTMTFLMVCCCFTVPAAFSQDVAMSSSSNAQGSAYLQPGDNFQSCSSAPVTDSLPHPMVVRNANVQIGPSTKFANNIQNVAVDNQVVNLNICANLLQSICWLIALSQFIRGFSKLVNKLPFAENMVFCAFYFLIGKLITDCFAWIIAASVSSPGFS